MQHSESTTFTNRTLITIAFKALGCYALLRAILGFLSAGSTLFMAGGMGMVRIPIGLQVLVHLLLALVLLRWPERLARAVFREETTLPRLSAGPTPQWYQMALALMGIWILLFRLPAHLLQIYAMHQALGSVAFIPDGRALVGQGVAFVIVALVLILGNRHLSRWLYGLHAPAYAPVEDDTHV